MPDCGDLVNGNRYYYEPFCRIWHQAEDALRFRLISGRVWIGGPVLPTVNLRAPTDAVSSERRAALDVGVLFAELLSEGVTALWLRNKYST
jgi:hypothetical protein